MSMKKVVEINEIHAKTNNEKLGFPKAYQSRSIYTQTWACFHKHQRNRPSIKQNMKFASIKQPSIARKQSQ